MGCRPIHREWTAARPYAARIAPCVRALTGGVAGGAPLSSSTPVVPCIPLWIEEPHRRKSHSELLKAEIVCCCSETPQSKEARPVIVVDADVPEGHGSRCGNHCAARDEECDAGRACGAMGGIEGLGRFGNRLVAALRAAPARLRTRHDFHPCRWPAGSWGLPRKSPSRCGAAREPLTLGG